jgi:dTDP-4-dehydrorhamnose reductase
MIRALVTGAGGQLGSELVDVLRDAGDDVIAADRARLDITSRDQVVGAITTIQPDVVFHCGAWTAVDACEGDPSRAFVTNALACRHVAEGARLAGAHVVSISTDYVFDGRKESPYVEWDATNPLSVYGRSKLGGEHEVLRGCAGAAIVRTSSVCGAVGSNIVKTVLRLAADPAQELAFVDDQTIGPTFTSDLAPLLRLLGVARLPGVFHATNQGATSWYGFVQAVLEAAGEDSSRVRPIATADLTPPRAAPRPANSVLEPAALRALGIDLLPDFHDPLNRLVKELLHG